MIKIQKALFVVGYVVCIKTHLLAGVVTITTVPESISVLMSDTPGAQPTDPHKKTYEQVLVLPVPAPPPAGVELPNKDISFTAEANPTNGSVNGMKWTFGADAIPSSASTSGGTSNVPVQFKPPVYTKITKVQLQLEHTVNIGTSANPKVIDCTSYTIQEGPHKGDPNYIDGVTIFPVDIRVNKTADSADDFVAVSNGTDGDLSTELSIQAFGPPMALYSATLAMKGTDGDIKFDPATISLAPGIPTKVKMWGKAASTAANSSTIQVKIAWGQSEIVAEKKVTVIDGVVLHFAGKFSSPINSINEGWRPGLRDALPKVYNAPPDVVSADSSDISSKISFCGGDQSMQLRAWSPVPEVKISMVEAKNPPNVVITKDSLNLAKMHMLQGAFQHNNGQHELIINPVIHFKDGTASIVSISILSRSDDTEIEGVSNTGGINPSVSSQIDTFAMSGNKLALWLQGAAPYNVAYNGVPGGDKRFFLDSIISPARYKWKNSKFKVAKESVSKISDSVGAKAILGAQELRGDNKTKLEFTLDYFNGWDFSGVVEDGKLTTP